MRGTVAKRLRKQAFKIWNYLRQRDRYKGIKLRSVYKNVKKDYYSGSELLNARAI